MKKKPDVQAVLDNFDNYTVDQLANLQGSHFPQWIRDALVRKKENMSKGDIDARAIDIAERMNEYHRLNNK
jgi:membrane protease subunit (stomatin/prohibitin family)